MGSRRRAVVWTEQARRQLDEVLAYISEDSLDGASRVLERVLPAAESLSTMSHRGRVVSEKGDPAIREVLVGSFRILYRVDDSAVVILAFLHQRRDFVEWANRQG